MSVARSTVVSDVVAPQALSAAYGLWAPALTRTHEAVEAAVSHWRALAELQINAADQAYRLAASHAERRQEAVTQMLETLWPVLAVALSKTEAADV
jgi:hypothetical protein